MLCGKITSHFSTNMMAVPSKMKELPRKVEEPVNLIINNLDVPKILNEAEKALKQEEASKTPGSVGISSTQNDADQKEIGNKTNQDQDGNENDFIKNIPPQSQNDKNKIDEPKGLFDTPVISGTKNDIETKHGNAAQSMDPKTEEAKALYGLGFSGNKDIESKLENVAKSLFPQMEETKRLFDGLGIYGSKDDIKSKLDNVAKSLAPQMEETKRLFDMVGISGTEDNIESKLGNLAKSLVPQIKEIKGVFDGICGTKEDNESKPGNAD